MSFSTWACRLLLLAYKPPVNKGPSTWLMLLALHPLHKLAKEPSSKPMPMQALVKELSSRPMPTQVLATESSSRVAKELSSLTLQATVLRPLITVRIIFY